MKKGKYRFINVIFFLILAVSSVALIFNATKNYNIAEVYAENDEANLPSSFTLVGTDTPPIDDQYNVGSCASESAAYMQFTNAVSKYIHANYPEIEWDPTTLDNKDNIFSPKFTYTLAGSGTALVYDVLIDHGCITMDKSTFYKNSNNGNQYIVDGELFPSAVSWDITDEKGFEALQFRLNGYEQVWVDRAPYVSTTMPTTANNQTNIMMTTSDAGRELIVKIKEALIQGNTVVTGGYPYRWNYREIDDSGIGTYGKIGDYAIVSASGTSSGGHNVSIVGYDDDITVTVNDVTLKGAFLMANSWGTSYRNDGYVWVMYDALNTVSEYEGLANYPTNRTWVFDQFCFTYWDKDVVVFERPERILKVDISVKNREAAYVVLTMRDNQTGKVMEHVPAVFYNGVDRVSHPDYGMYDWDGDNTEWLTFSGKQNGSAEKETFYLGYQSLIKQIPEGKTLSDYTFGAKFAAARGDTVTYSNISLIDGENDVIQDKNDDPNYIIDVPYEIVCESTQIDEKVFGGSSVFSCVKRHNVIVNNAEGCFLNYKSGSVVHGEKFEFTLSTVQGYDASDAVVTANGVRIFPHHGKYIIDRVTEDITIEISGVVKILKNKSTVNFYVDGSIYASYSYGLGEEIILPTEPQKDGYVFAGWKADIYEQEFACIEEHFPETMPGCSFNAYAKFAPAKTVQQLSGGRYETGMENYNGATVLLYKVSCDADIYNDLWQNRSKYEWTLDYSWKEGGNEHSFRQKGISPASEFESGNGIFFRFEICKFIDSLIPTKGIHYYVTLTIETDNAVYTVNGHYNGYYITVDPIYNTVNAKTLTASHYFSNGGDFEYWSKNTYMTLEFVGIDDSIYYGNYLWKLEVTDAYGNVSNYAYYTNSFYKFNQSDSDGLVRFPVLEMGWLPEYNGEYSIDFKVYDGNELKYTASLSDVKCKLRYKITWKRNGINTVKHCPIGQTPEYPTSASFESLSAKYDHIMWCKAVQPATADCEYISFGNYVSYDYVVTFLSGGTVSKKGCESGTPVAKPADPEKTGYTFVAWCIDEQLLEEYDFNSLVTDNLYLYAKFTANTYTVAFETSGGTAINAQDVTYGGNVTRPAAPVKTGYTFVDWYSNSSLTIQYNFDAEVTEDITLYAKYTINTYTVAFETSGGAAISSQDITYGGNVTRPAAPIKTGYTFVDWYSNSSLTIQYNFDAEVTEDITLYAKYTINTYTVTFETNGGAAISSQDITYGGKATRPAAPVKTGYTFVDWYSNSSLTIQYNFNTSVAEDITLYAKYIINTYNVTFVSEMGTVTEVQNVVYGGKASKPANPEKTGYTFNCWCADAALEIPFNFSNTAISENTTVFAKFTRNGYTVQFNTDTETVVAEQIVLYGNNAVKPADPEKEGYTFDGWYASEEFKTEFHFETPITDNVVLYAKYTKIIVMEFDCFVWNGYTAQAKYVCKDDDTIVEYYDAKVTNEITKEATAETNGILTYTATYDGHSETKEKIIPKMISSNESCSGEINGSSIAIYGVLAIFAVVLFKKRNRGTK